MRRSASRMLPSRACSRAWRSFCMCWLAIASTRERRPTLDWSSSTGLAASPVLFIERRRRTRSRSSSCLSSSTCAWLRPFIDFVGRSCTRLDLHRFVVTRSCGPSITRPRRVAPSPRRCPMARGSATRANGRWYDCRGSSAPTGHRGSQGARAAVPRGRGARASAAVGSRRAELWGARDRPDQHQDMHMRRAMTSAAAPATCRSTTAPAPP